MHYLFFDQIVSLSGKSVTYKDVIENLNVLDYEYFFRCIDGALTGNISSVLLAFNEILEKGFDGHNFIAGINSHLRDLLVSKDEATLKLLETTPVVRQRYLQQTAKCSMSFLFNALEIGSECELSYKNSKNQRLHIELALMKLCRLSLDQSDLAEKKKSDLNPSETKTEVAPLPPRSEILRTVEEQIPSSKDEGTGLSQLKHNPVIERPVKAFSIKDAISAENKPVEKIQEEIVTDLQVPSFTPVELTPENFDKAWIRFTDNLTSDGTRIVSMFKTIRPELLGDNKIRIHLSNDTQKDPFILNYRQKLILFMENSFNIKGLDIETTIDKVEKADILYTDEQKYNHLFGKYPILKEMKKSFNLDIM